MQNDLNTVKASNFGPHEKFQPSLASSLASSDNVPKMNRTGFANSKISQQLSFSLCFCRTCFDDSKFFWGKKKFKVYMRCKVRGFDGNVKNDPSFWTFPLQVP
jgi:hypothetical protein